MAKNRSPITELKNFGFLVPHLPEFEGELQDLLIEIDKLIEKKRTEWESELQNLEHKLRQKVKENQELQSLISTKEAELREASCRLNVIEHNFPAGSPEEELNAIKRKVDKMRRNYEVLQKKYRRQLGTEKEQCSTTLRQLEQTNALLKQEVSELRAETEKQLHSWKSLLDEEKSKVEKTNICCQHLQAELSDLNNRIDQERLENRNVEELCQSRCRELEAELEKARSLSRDQVTEIYEAKRKASEKMKELAHVSDELQIARTGLAETRNAVHHLELLVMQHIASVSKSVNRDAVTDVPCPSLVARSSILSKAELELKVKEIENKLQITDHEVTEKLNEMRRLEHACQTASGTIHRLVEARTQSMRQVASLSVFLNKAIHGMKALMEQVNNVEQLLSEKLLTTKTGMSRIQQALDKFRSLQPQKSVTRSMLDNCVQTISSEVEKIVQTTPNAQFSSLDFEHSQSDWATQTKQLHSMIVRLTEERNQLQYRLHHQLELAERLQKENLALSDVLTDSEQFNRMAVTCQNPLKEANRSRTRSVEVQVDPYPPSTQARLSNMRKSLPCVNKSPCAMSHPHLLGPSAFLDSQISPVRFRHLPPASQQAGITIDCAQPTANPDPNRTLVSSIDSGLSSAECRKQLAIPVNQSPIIPGRNDQPRAVGDFMDSLSPLNSPSEYVNFAVPDSNVIKSNLTPTSYGLPKRALCSPTVTQPIDTHRSRSLHVRFPVHAAAEYPTERRHSNEPSSDVIPNAEPLIFSGCPTKSYGPRDDISVPGLGDSVVSQASSTLVPRPSSTEALHANADYGNTDEGDCSVHALAAKFLADERKYSSHLEQKIDAHLEILKTQFGMNI